MAAANPSNGSESRSRKNVFKSANLFLEHLARRITAWVGGNWAFGIACAVVLGWLVSGPLFRYSDTWQLVINTGTTVVTFLMVFLIQRAQNKESRAIQLKLNELVAALEGASNRLIGVESLSEKELEILGRHYLILVESAKRDLSMTESHSVEEAERRHDEKLHRHRSTAQKTPAR